MKIKSNARLLILASQIVLCSTLSVAQSPSSLVNPMIGTGGHGHTFPGVTRPMSLVQISPDNKSFSSEWDWCSGYHYSDTNIVGFSHTHFSGTGIADLGDILLMPYIGSNPLVAEDNKEYTSGFSHKNEKSELGYYSVYLNKPKVKAELSSSDRVAIHRYTFPESKNAKIVIDLMHKIYWGHTEEAMLKFENDSTISGYRISGNGWQRHKRIYFYMKFSKPFINTVAGDKIDNVEHYLNTKSLKSGSTKGFVSFETKANEQIMIKVALSMVNVENARENMNEINHWDFEKVVAESKAVWNKYLNKIQIEASPEQKEIFYTSLYHTLVQPNQIADQNGAYMGPDYNYYISNTKKYYSTFSLWDTYRATHPLYTLILPNEVSDMTNSMMLHYNKVEYLPMWTAWGSDNHCMIANHSIPVITDAILKGIYTKDLDKVLEAMVKSSTEDHVGSPWQRTAYETRGYYAYELEHESISKTLESAFNDWCVAQVAKKLGKTDIYIRFMKRSEFFKNLFHPQHQLMFPKDKNGEWLKTFNPRKLGTGHVTEGNSWQYSWSVQHNPKGLIALFGNKNAFLKILDSTFSNKNAPSNQLSDVTGLIGQYAHGNEPSHHVCYLYNYAGKPWETQRLVRKIMSEMYFNKPDGLIGNEDCGQMSAWYIWNALGLYPSNPASGNYDLGSPIVSKATIDMGSGKQFVITAPKVTAKNIYVKSVKLNGNLLKRLYITHQEMNQGGTLEFEMTDKPNLKMASFQTPD